MSINLSHAKEVFQSRFDAEPEIATRAPGRVNIIGEHTDYNHGFVLPMAIEQETVILARRRDDNVLNAYATNLDRAVQAPLGVWERNPGESWIDYVVGVAYELSKLDKPLHGADLVILGDVPIGSGLSSSASLEMATLVMFEQLGGFAIEGPDGPQLGKRVENHFLGVNSGIMDQFIVRLGREGHALFLDCRSHDYDLVPVAFPSARFVIANTGVTRGLAASKYNERVAECAAAVEAMKPSSDKEGSHLRDYTMRDLNDCEKSLPDNVFRRARHVITEDERTREACQAMRDGDAAALGALMNASGDSLRDDYEVTCPELDAMTDIARDLPGCLGARMTGAGFGGCTVNLVETAHIDAFGSALLASYRDRTGIEGQVIASAPAEGAGTVPLG
ncbi:MAG: galactokinase [bacterium]|nr:galactokinase [bacterium]